MTTDFRIRVIVDPADAVRGTRRVEQGLDRVGRSATRVQRLISSTFAFVGLTAGITASIRLLAGFEQQMSTVRGITNATEEQFKSLRIEAQKLGATTRFSASQAAEGMIFLARAGFDVNQVLASVSDTLLLAQAGALDLGSAADIASNILKGFRLDVSEAGRVVDVLALAANSANTNVQQLGDGMKFVAPVAAGLKVPLEEATAAIAALSNAGLQGSLAGTGLRRVLAELESPAAKTQKVLRALGLSTDQVRVSQVGLTEALKRLRDAGVDTGLALEIFGDRGGPAFEVMSEAIPDIERLTVALGDAEGTARRIADVMDDNLNGALLAVRSAAEGLVIAFGEEGATGALRGFFELTAAGLRGLTGNIDTVVLALEVLVAVLVTRVAVAFTVAIAAAVAQMVALEFALGAATVKAALFSIALKGIQGALLTLATNPLTAIIIAFGLVVGAISLMETRTERVTRLTETLEGQVDRVKDAYSRVNGEVTELRDQIEDLTLTQALITQAELTEALGNQMTILGSRIGGLAFRTGDQAVVQELLRMSIAAHDGSLNLEDAKTRLDTLGASNEALRPAINEILKMVQQADDLNVALERSTALLKILQDTSTKADEEALGLGIPIPRPRLIRRTPPPSSVQDGEIDRLGKRLELMERIGRQLQNERDLVGLTNEQRETENRLFRIKEQFIKNLTPLTEAETAAIRAQIEALQDMEEALNLVNNVAETVFGSIEDALVDFIRTGEFNFKSFANNLIAELARIALQAFLLKPILAGLGSAFGGGSFFGGFQSASPNLSGLFGFQNGGSFTAGGTGGPDSQIFAARVSPGERIDFTPQGQSRSNGGGTTINFNITTPDADSFRRSQSQLAATATRVLSRGRRNT